MDDMEFNERLKLARARKYPEAKQAAEALGISPGTYGGWEAGSRRPKKEAVLDQLARRFGVPLLWLAHGQGTMDGQNVVPIMGYVGAGGSIEPEFEQVPPEGLGTVDLPFAVPPDIIGLEVRGDSMMPVYRARDIVLVWKNQRLATDSYVGEEAAVRTSDGFRYLKELQRGRTRGLYNLYSHNARLIEDVQIEWVGEIYLIIRAQQIQRAKRAEKATAARRATIRAEETDGMDELQLEPQPKRRRG